jgi:hypothetical protein
MKGTIEFTHDAEHDVHIARPRWAIETEADCKAWFAQYEDYFRGRGKVDVIFVLDAFQIGKGIGAVWGRYRTEVLRQFTRFSVRVNADIRVSTYVSTSSVQHGASFDEAPDLESALAVIEARRADLSGRRRA